MDLFDLAFSADPIPASGGFGEWVNDALSFILDTVQSVDPVLRTVLAGVAIMLETSILIGLVVPGDTVVLVASTAVGSVFEASILIAVVIVGALVGEENGFIGTSIAGGGLQLAHGHEVRPLHRGLGAGVVVLHSHGRRGTTKLRVGAQAQKELGSAKFDARKPNASAGESRDCSCKKTLCGFALGGGYGIQKSLPVKREAHDGSCADKPRIGHRHRCRRHCGRVDLDEFFVLPPINCVHTHRLRFCALAS